ncbi:hypothetical protein Q1695_010339 [Nippostrongylus brasiliensis]|nr:hypothetical protein Q1695_010339 [Nippostrongylus brasiliensis]
MAVKQASLEHLRRSLPPSTPPVPSRDLGDEQNLSWSKLQGTSELEDPEDVFGAAPSKQAPKAVTTDSKTELEECTAKDVSLREADTPPGSSSCDTTARAATPQESKTAVNENPTANPVTDIVSAFLPTTTPQSTQDPAEWKTDVADPNPPSGATK